MKFSFIIIDVIGQIVLLKLHEVPDFFETEYFFNLVLEVSKYLNRELELPIGTNNSHIEIYKSRNRKIVKSNQRICLQSLK